MNLNMSKGLFSLTAASLLLVGLLWAETVLLNHLKETGSRILYPNDEVVIDEGEPICFVCNKPGCDTSTMYGPITLYHHSWHEIPEKVWDKTKNEVRGRRTTYQERAMDENLLWRNVLANSLVFAVVSGLALLILGSFIEQKQKIDLKNAFGEANMWFWYSCAIEFVLWIAACIFNYVYLLPASLREYFNMV